MVLLCSPPRPPQFTIRANFQVAPCLSGILVFLVRPSARAGCCSILAIRPQLLESSHCPPSEWANSCLLLLRTHLHCCEQAGFPVRMALGILDRRAGALSGCPSLLILSCQALPAALLRGIFCAADSLLELEATTGRD